MMRHSRRRKWHWKPRGRGKLPTITKHAIDRWRERVGGLHLPFHIAKRRLKDSLRAATPIHRRYVIRLLGGAKSKNVDFLVSTQAVFLIRNHHVLTVYQFGDEHLAELLVHALIGVWVDSTSTSWAA